MLDGEESLTSEATHNSIGTTISGEFEKDPLLEALEAASAPFGKDDEMVVQFTFHGNQRITLAANSSNMEVQHHFEAPYTGQGTVKIAIRELRKYLSLTPPEKIIYAFEAQSRFRCKVGQDHEFTLNLFQDSPRSEIKPPQRGTQVELPVAVFHDWVSSFLGFVAEDDQRFYANGALIQCDLSDAEVGPQLRAVATDATCLALSRVKGEGCGLSVIKDTPEQVLVPQKMLKELHRATANAKGNIVLRWCEEDLIFSAEIGNFLYNHRTIAGKYPVYQNAIPSVTNTELMVPTKALLKSILIASTSMEKAGTAKFEFNAEKVYVTGQIQGKQSSKSSVKVLKLTEGREAFVVLLDVSYMKKILSHIDGEDCSLQWEEPVRPLKVMGTPKKGLDSFYLLVPSRH